MDPFFACSALPVRIACDFINGIEARDTAPVVEPRREPRRQHANAVAFAARFNILSHLVQKFNEAFFAEQLYVVCKFRGHLVTKLCTEFFATFFATATPVAEPAFFKIKMRLVPKNGRDFRIADGCNPLVHIGAELRVVRAGGHFRFPVYGNLAHVVIACCEFRISFTAKHATNSPRIHINAESHRGRIVHDLLHGVVIVLQVLFAPSMEHCIVACFFYLYKVYVCKLRRAHTKVANAFNHG